MRARLPGTGSFLLCAATVGWLAAAFISNSGSAATIGADAVVLINSASPTYPDFQHRLQPYLDNFGVPYTVLDIATNTIDTNIARYAVIIIGHSQLDTNSVQLDTNAQQSLTAAVANGTGLVNFDGALSSGSAPRYQFIQSIFGFAYGTAVSGGSVNMPATQPASQMHFITARHPVGDTVGFRSGITVPGLTAPSNVTAIAVSGGKPFVAVTKFGQGRAVQWGSYDWMPSAVLGPLEGLDDLVWRSIVWAARKPFVMRGLPNFVTLRMDDATGPFWWAHMAGNLGFKPYVSAFIGTMKASDAADLRGLVTNGVATASVHSFDCCATFFFFDNQHSTSYADSVMTSNFNAGTQWHITNGIPISSFAAIHYSEVGTNVFAGMQAWNFQYIFLKNYPGTVRHSPWLTLGPYRLYEPQQFGDNSLPVYYADFLTIPSHPEFNGQFFNVGTEIRDDASCNEWCPANNDVPGSIGRGTRQVKRAFDSMVLATLYTHEWYLIPIPLAPNQTPISSNNWLAILQGVTNNLATYNPSYVTMDYACQYIRATRTSRMEGSSYDPVVGQVTAAFSGKTDLDTLVYTYTGDDNVITNQAGTVPAFAQGASVAVANLRPPPLSIALTATNSVLLSWPGPASGFVLQQNPIFGTTNWTAITDSPVSLSWQLQYIVPNPGSNMFFRLNGR